jgi:hypothetical protein
MIGKYENPEFNAWLARLGYKLADYQTWEWRAFWRAWLAHTLYTGVDRAYVERELAITREAEYRALNLENLEAARDAADVHAMGNGR